MEAYYRSVAVASGFGVVMVHSSYLVAFVFAFSPLVLHL